MDAYNPRVVQATTRIIGPTYFPGVAGGSQVVAANPDRLYFYATCDPVSNNFYLTPDPQAAGVGIGPVDNSNTVLVHIATYLALVGQAWFAQIPPGFTLTVWECVRQAQPEGT